MRALLLLLLLLLLRCVCVCVCLCACVLSDAAVQRRYAIDVDGMYHISPGTPMAIDSCIVLLLRRWTETGPANCLAGET